MTKKDIWIEMLTDASTAEKIYSLLKNLEKEVYPQDIAEIFKWKRVPSEYKHKEVELSEEMLERLDFIKERYDIKSDRQMIGILIDYEYERLNTPREKESEDDIVEGYDQ